MFSGCAGLLKDMEKPEALGPFCKKGFFCLFLEIAKEVEENEFSGKKV